MIYKGGKSTTVPPVVDSGYQPTEWNGEKTWELLVERSEIEVRKQIQHQYATLQNTLTSPTSPSK